MNVNKLYILFLILMSLAVNANEFGFMHVKNNPILQNALNNQLIKNKIIIGKTYTVDLNNYDISTSTNDNVSFKLACDTSIKMLENTSITIDKYEQGTVFSQYPSQTQYDKLNCNISLINGELYIINNANSNDTNTFYINTALGFIMLNKGKFVIKTDGTTRSTFVIVEGTATSMDNSTKKLYKLKEKDIIIFSPKPYFSGRASDLVKKQNVASLSLLDNEDLNFLVTEFNAFEKEQGQYIFVTTDNANKLVKLKK